ncbi:MAG: peptidyl-prolyl cis-trans isomerase [Chitinispirillaceae bacterium]
MKAVRKYHSALVVILLSVLILAVCSSKPSSPVIARVGKSVLTLDDLFNSIPPEYSEQITHEQNANYVRQWIRTELLFQEALRRKIDREKEIKARLDKMKKDLLSAEIVNRCSRQNEETISDKAIREYYEKNKKQFIREKDVVRYQEIVVDELSTAREVRREVNEDNFGEVAAVRSKYPSSDPENTPFISVNAIPPVLRKAITRASAPSIIGPVKTDEGYHIIRVIRKLEKGGICTEQEVREEIISQLSNASQKGEVERLVAELRLKTDVEFNFDLIPDSDKPGEIDKTEGTSPE